MRFNNKKQIPKTFASAAAMVAVAIAVSLPGVYLLGALDRERELVEIAAKQTAGEVGNVLTADGGLPKEKAEKILSRRPAREEAEMRIMETLAGDMVARSPDALREPIHCGRAPVLQSGVAVAAILVCRSWVPLILRIAGLAGVGIGLAGAVLFFVSRFPVGALTADLTELAHRYQERETLYAISLKVLSSSDHRAVLEEILDKLLMTGPFDLGVIRLLDRRENQLEPVLWRGFHYPEGLKIHRLGHAQTGTGTEQVFNQKETHVIQNVPELEGLRTFKRENIRSAVVVPVWTGEKVLGVIQLGSRSAQEFSPEQVRLLETIGNQLGLAVQLNQHRELLEEMVALRTVELSEANKELAQTIDQLEEAKEAADASNRSKSQFLANMSHEIRTPMNGILGMTELVMNTALEDRQRRFIETVYRSGKTLLGVINEILDFSKIEAGQMELEEVDFNLREICDEVVVLLAEGAHRKGLELTCEVSAQVPVGVRGDPYRLRQVITNLVGNAIKFTERGEVALRVEVLGEVGDAVSLRFEVRDTGIGIAPERQAQIFESFNQADNSTTRKYGGTGLGLAIAKRLVEMMRGEIGVQSQAGEGALFWFRVGLERQEVSEGWARLGNGTELRGRRVLVVDDNETNRTIVHHQVLSWGMRNGTAADGEQALRILREAAACGDPYDLAVLDMHMPGMDGVELSRAIKAEEALKAVGLVMLTSVGLCEGWEELRRAGIAAHLTKPVRSSELYDCLVGVVGGGSATTLCEATGPQGEGQAGLRFEASVLLAEDNPVNQEVAVSMLEELGCGVEVAADGREVLDRLGRRSYDLILMDCQMPELDGLEATRLIRQREQIEEPIGDTAGKALSHVPIVALTANALQGDRETCLAAGMDDFLSKPFSLDQLGNVLKRWVGGKLRWVSEGAVSSCGEAARLAGDQAQGIPPASMGQRVIEREALENIRALQRPGGPNLVGKVIGKYLSSTPALMETLRRAVSEGDARAVQMTAHTLKSSSANVGATRLAARCKELELGAKAERLGQVHDQLQDLEIEYHAVTAALQTELQQNP